MEIIYNLFLFIFTFCIGCILAYFHFLFNVRKNRLSQNKKLYSDLSNWQDIPEFESKEDIELYLKNKIEKDILEQEIKAKEQEKKNRDRSFNPKLMNYLYKKHGVETASNYTICHNSPLWDYYEDQFKKEKDKNNLLEKTYSGGQQKTHFFNSHAINEVNKLINNLEKGDSIEIIPPPPDKPELSQIRYIKSI